MTDRRPALHPSMATVRPGAVVAYRDDDPCCGSGLVGTVDSVHHSQGVGYVIATWTQDGALRSQVFTTRILMVVPDRRVSAEQQAKAEVNLTVTARKRAATNTSRTRGW